MGRNQTTRRGTNIDVSVNGNNDTDVPAVDADAEGWIMLEPLGDVPFFPALLELQNEGWGGTDIFSDDLMFSKAIDQITNARQMLKRFRERCASSDEGPEGEEDPNGTNLASDSDNGGDDKHEGRHVVGLLTTFSFLAFAKLIVHRLNQRRCLNLWTMSFTRAKTC